MSTAFSTASRRCSKLMSLDSSFLIASPAWMAIMPTNPAKPIHKVQAIGAKYLYCSNFFGCISDLIIATLYVLLVLFP